MAKMVRSADPTELKPAMTIQSEVVVLRNRVLRWIGVVLIVQAVPRLIEAWLHANQHFFDFQEGWRSITKTFNLIVDLLAVVAGLSTCLRPMKFPLVIWSILSMLGVVNWLVYEAMPSNPSFQVSPATVEFWKKVLADFQYVDVRFWLPALCLAICWAVGRNGARSTGGFEVV